MSDDPKCEACGVTWREHLGTTGLCSRVQALLGLLREVSAAPQVHHARGYGEYQISDALTKKIKAELKR